MGYFIGLFSCFLMFSIKRTRFWNEGLNKYQIWIFLLTIFPVFDSMLSLYLYFSSFEYINLSILMKLLVYFAAKGGGLAFPLFLWVKYIFTFNGSFLYFSRFFVLFYYGLIFILLLLAMFFYEGS